MWMTKKKMTTAEMTKTVKIYTINFDTNKCIFVVGHDSKTN